ncbi:cytochrome P450 [Syncephalis pseudoplumigaleata]|uniref:Cytochrome P450 n=1 Tax=Syncephalis pseudoplumigaleata TaxID=1712513 RepID=A0A4P9YZR1_9FUNG|nr:cytochrome P450 [Syncephalis pseudoplumigaleata]|eukprot:RKP25594.1 cytochrome P450 [Syncephalis pseudoplumigaleata]
MCFFHGQEVHLAEDYYGAESRVFNPYHHYKPETSDATKPTTANDSFLVFGIGHHMCPGRFLAVMAIKIIAAYALRHYDFSVLSGKRPTNTLRDGTSHLPMPEPIVLQARPAASP